MVIPMSPVFAHHVSVNCPVVSSIITVRQRASTFYIDDHAIRIKASAEISPRLFSSHENEARVSRLARGFSNDQPGSPEVTRHPVVVGLRLDVGVSAPVHSEID